MRKLILRILPFLFAIILALVILWPIRQSGAWYPMHDSTHPARVILMSWTLSSAQIPPVWAGIINGGFGYPLFHFYAPLFHSVATGLSMLYFYPTTAIKITLFISVAVGSLGAYYFAKRWGRSAAIVSAVAFALSPYLASNIYVRGAFSEYLSITIIPWVLLTSERLKSWKQSLIASVLLSLFLLSHNLIPILVLPMIFIWMVYHNHLNLRWIITTFVITGLLTAWFLIPLIFERHFTQADSIARTTTYSLHFVTPGQIWNSTWGFGGSALGVEDGMSFKVGKIQIILGLAGVIFALFKKKPTLVPTSKKLPAGLYL